jgi:hypothetical protein
MDGEVALDSGRNITDDRKLKSKTKIKKKKFLPNLIEGGQQRHFASIDK